MRGNPEGTVVSHFVWAFHPTVGTSAKQFRELTRCQVRTKFAFPQSPAHETRQPYHRRIPPGRGPPIQRSGQAQTVPRELRLPNELQRQRDCREHPRRGWIRHDQERGRGRFDFAQHVLHPRQCRAAHPPSLAAPQGGQAQQPQAQGGHSRLHGRAASGSAARGGKVGRPRGRPGRLPRPAAPRR